MPRMNFRIAAISAALFACAIPVQAQEHHGRLAEAFARADTNSDGMLDRQEALALPRIARNFDAIDADNSGSITLGDIRTHMHAQAQLRRERGEQRFAAADANGDGVLDREEAQALPKIARNFDAIDSDNSGTVSHQELIEYRKGKRQARNR